jgi:hypothetical protein
MTNSQTPESYRAYHTLVLSGRTICSYGLTRPDGMAAASNRIAAVYCVRGGMMNPNFRLHEATPQSFLHRYQTLLWEYSSSSPAWNFPPRAGSSRSRRCTLLQVTGSVWRDAVLRQKRRRASSPPHRASFRDWSRSCGMSFLCNGTNPSRLPIEASTGTEPRGPIRAFEARERCPWSRARVLADDERRKVTSLQPRHDNQRADAPVPTRRARQGPEAPIEDRVSDVLSWRNLPGQNRSWRA